MFQCNIISSYRPTANVLTLLMSCISTSISLKDIINLSRKNYKYKYFRAQNTRVGLSNICYTTDYTEPETPKLFSRNANIGDLTLNLYKEGLLEIQYSFIPKKDIKNLQITINIKDDESTVLNTQIKNLGNVIEGNQYFFTVKLTELSLSGFFDANNLTMAVTGGTVSYFS